MTQEVQALVHAAHQAASAGRWDEAGRLWGEVHRADPNNAQALFGLGGQAMQRGAFLDAVSFFQRACAAKPDDLFGRLMLAGARREQGDVQGELKEIDAALTIDPYFVPGILAKAQWHERRGSSSMAVFYYKTAVKLAPPDHEIPTFLRSQLQYAREKAERGMAAMEAHLNAATEQMIAKLPAAEAERWRESIAIRSGRSEPFHATCNQFLVPRLPAIPFFDRALFPWAEVLEAKTELITQELTRLLASKSEDFIPYISMKPGEPVNQWAALNKSSNWSVFHLIKHGVRVEEHCRECPETMKALEATDLADIEGYCPNVMFSALAPHTSIPPHSGETNARLVAHLPLIVPDKCRYRVGFEHRTWEVGKLLIFDDTIEHEALNDSDELRVVLLFDIWHPLLSSAERKVMRALSAATRSFAPRLSL